jgi:hypothetical protein
VWKEYGGVANAVYGESDPAEHVGSNRTFDAESVCAAVNPGVDDADHWARGYNNSGGDWDIVGAQRMQGIYQNPPDCPYHTGVILSSTVVSMGSWSFCTAPPPSFNDCYGVSRHPFQDFTPPPIRRFYTSDSGAWSCEPAWLPATAGEPCP